MKRIAGLVLLTLGLSWLLLSVLNFTFTETVIDKAFVLEPGEWYGGMGENRTAYWYRGFEVLKGKVSVEGGGINFTAGGDFIERAVERVFVDSYYNFTIDSRAGHFCAFGFDNTGGNATSYVKFVLNETSTESLTWRLMVRSSAGARARATQVDWWIFSLLGSLVLLPIGFILTFRSLLSKKKAHAD